MGRWGNSKDILRVRWKPQGEGTPDVGVLTNDHIPPASLRPLPRVLPGGEDWRERERERAVGVTGALSLRPIAVLKGRIS